MGIVDDHKKALEFIEDVTTNTHKVQKQVLSQILSISSQVDYLQRHGLNGRTDRETYKNTIPTITYEHLKPFMERIANGDASPILCGRPLTDLILSSGTSGGERKIFPCTEEEMERICFARSLVMPVVSKYITGMDKGKAMFFMFSRENAYTHGGLPYCDALTFYYRSSQFRNRPYDPFEDYTSPDETILCEDFYQSTYSQCLCALYQSKRVVRVGSVFLYGLLRIIRFLQKHWSLLCNDIRTGTVNAQIIKDVSVRKAVEKVVVKPDPELAHFIELECERDASWKGIIARLWPNAKYIDAIITGSMAQHIPCVDFYSNGLPFVAARYACSECFLGINLNPLCKPDEVAYTLIPTMAYFEFLPLFDDDDNNQQEQQLVDLADVELGHEYELFVTTYTGLYRYGVGDVLRVVGFKNTAPQFRYICRKKILLSIDCEKTNELELGNAVQNAMKHLTAKFNDLSLVDYTSFADTASTSDQGHYVIYWELGHHKFNVSNATAAAAATTTPSSSVFEECCLIVEESLNSEYKENRTLDKSIGPLEIKIVEMGTFDKLMDCAVSKGSSVSQYKTPRCVKNVDLLNSCVVSNYFSQEFPNYSPGL